MDESNRIESNRIALDDETTEPRIERESPTNAENSTGRSTPRARARRPRARETDERANEGTAHTHTHTHTVLPDTGITLCHTYRLSEYLPYTARSSDARDRAVARARRRRARMSTANPFSALERDGSSVGADRAPSSAANAASSSTKRRHRAKKRSSTAGAMTREALMRAREEAHAAMERKLRNGRDECDAWGRVGKGNGLAKSTAKRMAKERAAAAGRRDETKEQNEEEEEEEEEEGTGAMVKESTRVVDGGKSERAFAPKVSEVFHHTFAETGASCWCVDVKDEYGGDDDDVHHQGGAEGEKNREWAR